MMLSRFVALFVSLTPKASLLQGSGAIDAAELKLLLGADLGTPSLAFGAFFSSMCKRSKAPLSAVPLRDRLNEAAAQQSSWCLCGPARTQRTPSATFSKPCFPGSPSP